MVLSIVEELCRDDRRSLFSIITFVVVFIGVISDVKELYRDGRRSLFKNHDGNQNDKIQKGMIDLLNEHQLNLEIKCN